MVDERPHPSRRRRLARRANRAYHRRLGRRTHDPRGVDVAAADWDLLVVLDACRYDAFARRSWLPGTAERRRSRGSHTSEFLWGSFAGRELHDTVYVTANVQPYVYREAIDCHHVEHAWLDGFDAEAGTVPPDALADAALSAAERFPRKRVVAHVLQPHYPFLGGPSFEHGTVAFWEAVAAGDVDATPDLLRTWHERTLERALPAVERLLEGVEGRAVVTADHGTALGERVHPVPVREWGHPWGVYAGPLVTVPWLVVEGDGRRRVEADPPVDEGVDADDDAVQRRLDALGYA
jgi:hypothetical protein